MKTKFIMALAATALLSACASDDPKTPGNPDVPGTSTPTGAYLLCAGNYDQNNAALDFFNPQYPDELTTKVFSSTNGRALGSNANDMTIHGKKMYIVVSTSNTLEITDLRAKAIKTLNFVNEAGQPQEPRYVTAAGSKVYVSLYDGNVAVVDTASLTITKRIPVGPNPEELCVIGDRLYVAESGGANWEGGYNNTVGVINLATETRIGEITVGTNPNRVAADQNGNLYVLTFGNYFDEPNKLTRINPATLNDETLNDETLATASQILFSVGSDRVYAYCATQENWVVTEKRIDTYPTAFGNVTASAFLTDEQTPADVYSLSANPADNSLYVGSTDYTTYGSFTAFAADGSTLAHHGLSSINPQGAWFVR